MSEWDTGSPDYGKSDAPAGKQPVRAGGGLHWPMAIVCLVVVAGVSFGMAYLMKDKVRNFFEMGLTFAAPFAVLMLSAILTEKYTGGMVPACSRKAQLMFAAGTIVAAFVFGCLAEVIHQPVKEEYKEPEYDYVIMEDVSISLRTKGNDEPCREALHKLINGMADENRVGFIAFRQYFYNEDERKEYMPIAGEAEIQPLGPKEGSKQRSKIKEIIDLEIPIFLYKTIEDVDWYTGPSDDYEAGMEAAMRLIDNLEASSRPIRIILVTDAKPEIQKDEDGNPKRDENQNYVYAESPDAFKSFNAWAEERNNNSTKSRVELCGVQIANPMLDIVRDAITRTGGQIFDKTDPKELTEKLGALESGVFTFWEPVDTLKATYDGKTADGKPNTGYVIVSGVMLLLLGLLSGFSLMIMFSLRGQFRIQVILSAVMGLLAFAFLFAGKSIGIAPPWVCEAIAFSCFGLVLMNKNMSGGSASRSVNQKAAPVPPAPDGFDDF